jgi:hypothetical protein
MSKIQKDNLCGKARHAPSPVFVTTGHVTV